MSDNEPKLIEKNLDGKKEKGKVDFVDGKPVAKKRKRSGCLTCLVSFCCVVVVLICGIFGAGFILYEEYARPIIGISLPEAFGLLKGIYSPDRDEIITNPYDETGDNKAFYDNLKSALCLPPDFEISITDILNNALTDSDKYASAYAEPAENNFTTGNAYFDEILSKAKFDFSSLEDYDGSAKYLNITDRQVASLMQEALQSASVYEPLKEIETALGVKAVDVTRVEQVIFTESSSNPKITATLGMDVRKILSSVIEFEKDTFASVPKFIRAIIPKLLPKEILVSLTFFPNTDVTSAIDPIISINTANDKVLRRMLDSIDNYIASGGGDKIFTPTFTTVATTINTYLTTLTDVIGEDSLVYNGANNTLKVDTIGAVLMAMDVQNVSSSDFYTMIQHLHSVDYKGKTEEELIEFLKTVIPDAPDENKHLQPDLDNIEKSYGINTEGWTAANILENFDESIIEKVNLAEMNYLLPDEMKKSAKLSGKSLALVLNEYLENLNTNTVAATSAADENPDDFLGKLQYSVADVNIGYDVITDSATRKNTEKLYLSLVIKVSVKDYISEIIGNQIYTNLVLSIIPDNLYLSARVLVDNPQPTDKIGISLNFNQDGTDAMLDTLTALLTKFSPEAASAFDRTKMTEELENILYPIIKGEPNKDGKYLLPIALSFQDGYVNLPSVYELVYIIGELTGKETSENAFIDLTTPAAEEDVGVVYRALSGLVDYESGIDGHVNTDGSVNLPVGGVDLFKNDGLVKGEFEGKLFLKENTLKDDGVAMYDQLTTLFSNVKNLNTIDDYIDFPRLKTSSAAPSEMNMLITANEFVKLFESTLTQYMDEIKKSLPYATISAFAGECYLKGGKPYVKMQLFAQDLTETFPENLAGGFADINIKPKQIFPKYLMMTADIEMEPQKAARKTSTFSDLYYKAAGEEPPPPSNRKITLSLNTADHNAITRLLKMFVKDGAFDLDALIAKLASTIDASLGDLEKQNIKFQVVENPDKNIESDDDYVIQSTNIYSLINSVIFKDTAAPNNADNDLQSLICKINDTDGARDKAGAENIVLDYSAVNGTLRENYFLNIADDRVNPVKHLQGLGDNISSVVDVNDIKNASAGKDAVSHTAAFTAGELAKMMQEYIDDESFDITSFLPNGLYDAFYVHSLHIAANQSINLTVRAAYSNAAPPPTADVAKLTSLLLPTEAYLTMTLNLPNGDAAQTMAVNLTEKAELDYLMTVVNLNKNASDEDFINIDESLDKAGEQLNNQLNTMTESGICYTAEEDNLIFENFYGVMYKYVMKEPADVKKLPAADANSRKLKAAIAQMQTEKHADVGSSNVAADLSGLNGQLSENFGITKLLTMDNSLTELKTLFTLENFDARSFAQKTGLGADGLGAPNADYSNIVFRDEFDKVRITDGELAGLLNKVKSDMFEIEFIKDFAMHGVSLYEDLTGFNPNILITYRVTVNKDAASEPNDGLEFVNSLMPNEMYLTIKLNMLTREYASGVDKVVINDKFGADYTDYTDFIFTVFNKNSTSGGEITQQSIIGGDGTENNSGVKSNIYDNINNELVDLNFRNALLVSDNLYPAIYEMILTSEPRPTEEKALTLKRAMYSLYHYSAPLDPNIAALKFSNINNQLKDNYFVNFDGVSLADTNPINRVSEFEKRLNIRPNDMSIADISNDKKLTVNKIDLASLIEDKLTSNAITVDIFESMNALSVDIRAVNGNNVITVNVKAVKRTNMQNPPSYYSLMPNDLYISFNIDMTADTNSRIKILAPDSKNNGAISGLLSSIIDIADSTAALNSVKAEINSAFDVLSANPVYDADSETITFDSFYVFTARKLNEGITPAPNPAIEAQSLKNAMYYLNIRERTDGKKLTEADLTYGYPDNKKTMHDVVIDEINHDDSYVNIYDSVIQSVDAASAAFINFRFISESANAATLKKVFLNFTPTASTDYLTGKTILVTKDISLERENIGNSLLIRKIVPEKVYLTVMFKDTIATSRFIINDMPLECMEIFDTVTESKLNTTLRDELTAISDDLTVTVDILGDNKTLNYSALMTGEFSSNIERVAENYARFSFSQLLS